MKNLTTSGLVLSLFFLGLSQAPVRGFTLDTFTESNTSVFGDSQFVYLNLAPVLPDTPIDVDTGLNGGSVFGEQREISITNNNGASSPIFFSINNNNSQQANLNVGTGDSASAEIIWDGNDLSNTPTDFTIDNGVVQQSLQLVVVGLDGGQDRGVELNFELRDTSNNVATISQLIQEEVSSMIGNTPKSFYFAYQDRVEEDPLNPINLTQVDYIRFYTSNEDVGVDFAFDFLQTSQFVPFEFSPALGIMLGGSFIGLNILKKRMNK